MVYSTLRVETEKWDVTALSAVLEMERDSHPGVGHRAPGPEAASLSAFNIGETEALGPHGSES